MFSEKKYFVDPLQVENYLLQPTQNVMIFDRYVCGRSRTHHLLPHHMVLMHAVRILQILLAYSNSFSLLEISQLLEYITVNNFSKIQMIRDYSLNRVMTKISLFLQFFFCNIRIIIDNALDFFDIFRCGHSNRSSRSCFVANLFSIFTKIFRPLRNSPKRRSFVTENSTQFIMNNCWLSMKYSAHFYVRAKIFLIYLKRNTSLSQHIHTLVNDQRGNLLYVPC